MSFHILGKAHCIDESLIFKWSKRDINGKIDATVGLIKVNLYSITDTPFNIEI